MLYEKALNLKVTGVIRPKPTAETTMLTGTICYTHLLTEYIINQAKETEIGKAQIANPNIDVLTGLPFKSNTGSLTNEQKEIAFKAYIEHLNTKSKADIYKTKKG